MQNFSLKTLKSKLKQLKPQQIVQAAFVGLVGFKILQVSYKRLKKCIEHRKKKGLHIEKKSEMVNYFNRFKKKHDMDIKLDPETLKIVKSGTINELKKLMFQGMVTCEQIVKVHILDVMENLQSNAIVEPLFFEALKQAKQLDQEIAQDKTVIYKDRNEFFGIPFLVPYIEDESSPNRNNFHHFHNSNINYMIRKQKGIILAKAVEPKQPLLKEAFRQLTGKELYK